MAGIGSMVKEKCSDMRHRISVEYCITTIDSSRQPRYSYATRFASEPASFQQVTGGEKVRGRQIEAGVSAVFNVNHRDGYLVTDRVLFGGVYYGIVRIQPPDGINRFLTLYCNA